MIKSIFYDCFPQISKEKEQKIGLLKSKFGAELKIDRLINPESLNWESSAMTTFTWKELSLYMFLLLFICPLVSFYLNYRFYVVDVE